MCQSARGPETFYYHFTNKKTKVWRSDVAVRAVHLVGGEGEISNSGFQVMCRDSFASEISIDCLSSFQQQALKAGRVVCDGWW